MDIIRSKKRGFFTVSHSESSTPMTKKKVKGITSSGQNLVQAKFENPQNDLDSSISSTNSSGEVDTESSCDDINIASRKLKTFAKKSIRRDKKKEKDKLERKEKNKISMDDFLCKQLEFHMWLEEEKNKQPKEMSSPKLKRYFKVFLKLWNKKKLPQRFFRGLADTESPCPSRSSRVFNFLDGNDDRKVVGFTRPKSKRLSIEPCGLLDSPFSTFGKTPPKKLQMTSLQQLETLNPVMSVSKDLENHEIEPTPVKSTDIKLGEYQIPLNAVAVSENQKENQCPTDRQAVPYKMSTCPWLSEYQELDVNEEGSETSEHTSASVVAEGIQEMSPVYAVPWKPKSKKNPPKTLERKEAVSCQSPSPPPVPPPLYRLEKLENSSRCPKILCDQKCPETGVSSEVSILGKNEVESERRESTHHTESPGYACPSDVNIQSSSVSFTPETKDAPLSSVRSSAIDGHSVKRGRCINTGYLSESSDNNFNVADKDMNGWQNPVRAKIFKSSVFDDMTYSFSKENKNRDISSTNQTDGECILETDRNPKTSLWSEVDFSVSMKQCDSTDQYSSSKGFEAVTYTNPIQRSPNFSFSKYLITPEKKSYKLYKSESSFIDSLSDKMETEVTQSRTLSSKQTQGVSQQQKTKFADGEGRAMKEDGNMCVQKTGKGRQPLNFNITMKVTDGLLNQRNFILSKSTDKSETENNFTGSRMTIHNTKLITGHQKTKSTTEKGLKSDPITHKHAKLTDFVSRKICQSTPASCLETDIDVTPVPIMGSKTPPRQRRQLSSLPRTKSLETIIW